MAFLPILAIGRIGALAGRGVGTAAGAVGRGVGTAASATARGARRQVKTASMRAAEAANIAIADNAQEDLERKARGHSNQVVAAVRAAARARRAQAAILAKTVEWTNKSALERNQIAQITFGGNLPIGRRKVPAYKLAFGSEFGSRIHRQFPEHLRAGWWFYRTVRRSMAEGRMAGAAADDAVRQWAGPTQQHD